MASHRNFLLAVVSIYVVTSVLYVSHCSSAEVSNGQEDETSDSSKEWYSFLDNIYSIFSSYEKQNDNHIDRLSGLESRQDDRFFQDFLDYLDILLIPVPESIRQIKLTQKQLDEFYHILDLMVGKDRTITCTLDSDTMIVKGDYIKFKVFLNEKKECSEILHSTKVKKLNIYGFNSIFIDKDLIAEGRQLEVSMVAPKFVVIGNRTINLRGLNGGSYEKPAEKGKDGKAGMPGKPGGNFFGLAGEIVDGQKLKIIVNGGDGGPGQEGGEGITGIDGEPANVGYDNPRCTPSLCKHGVAIVIDKTATIRTEHNCTSKHQHYVKAATGFGFGFATSEQDCKATFFGAEGTPPGPGGNGGAKGEQGKPGKIYLLQFNDRVNVDVKESLGSYGLSGKAGAAGKPCKDGPTVSYQCQRFGMYSSNVAGSEEGDTVWIEKKRVDSTVVHTSVPGEDNISTLGKTEVDLPRAPRLQYEVINEYKTHLIENLQDLWKRRPLGMFLDQMNGNETVKNKYNILGLAKELLIMEERVHFWREKLNYEPLYRSLLHRISEYAETSNAQTSLEDKIILHYLFTSTLSRINNLKNNSLPRLVFKIPERLELIEKGIQELKSSKKEDDQLKLVIERLNMTNTIRTDYKAKISEKVDDAESYVTEIFADIKSFEEGIDSGLKLIIGNIVTEEGKSLEEQQGLMVMKEELAQKLQQKAVLNIVKHIGKAAQLLGPVGVTASQYIDTATGVIDSLALDTSRLKPPTQQLKDSLAGVSGMFESMKRQESEGFEKVLNSLYREAEKHKELDDLVDKTSQLKENLKNAKTLDDIERVKEQFEEALQKKNEELNPVSTTNSTPAQKVVGSYSMVVKYSGGVYDLFYRIAGGKDDIDAMNNAIKLSEQRFEILRQLQRHVRYTLTPTLRVMENKLNEIAGKLGERSRTSLDVTQWKIELVLKDVRIELNKSLGKLPSSDTLDRAVEKLGSAMNMLIKTYKNIGDYEDEKLLVDLHADLTSVAVQTVNITNAAIRLVKGSLDHTMGSILLLQEYKRTVDAFKEFMFPAVDDFFGDMKVPSQLEPVNDLDTLIASAQIQTKHLIEKYRDYESTPQNSRKCISFEDFYNVHNNTAFYNWTNSRSNGMISELLSGKEVTVTADILQSPACTDAVKFNVLKLRFLADDPELQSEIDDKLYNYVVDMKHMGDSFYLLQDKIYEMKSDIIEFTYSFKKKELVSSNVDKIQLSEKKLKLSPYTTWKFRLRRSSTSSHARRRMKINPQPKSSNRLLTGLEEYADKVTFLLEGEGEFVDRAKRDCPVLEVDKYFEPMVEYYRACPFAQRK